MSIYYCSKCGKRCDNDYEPAQEDPFDPCELWCEECYEEYIEDNESINPPNNP